MQEYNEDKAGQNGSILPIFLIIIAFGLVVSSLLLPWWTVKMDVEADEGSGSLEGDYYLQYIEATARSGDDEVTVKEDYSKMEDSSPNMVHFWNNTYYLMIATLIASIASVIAVPLVVFRKISFEWKAAVAILAFLLIFSSICFAYYLPQAMEKDAEKSTSEEFTFKTKETEGNAFWGSGRITAEDGSLEAKWGPTYGWFLPLIAFFFAIGAFYYTKLPQPVTRKGEETRGKPLTEAEKLEALKLRLVEEKMREEIGEEKKVSLEERVSNIIHDKFVEGEITEDTYNVLKSKVDEYKKLKHQVEKEMTMTSYEDMLKELRQSYADEKISEDDYKKLKGRIERLEKIETEIRNAEV